MQYIAQRMTPTGVIFDYANQDNVVESLFYSNEELRQMAKGISPEFDEAKDYTSIGLIKDHKKLQ